MPLVRFQLSLLVTPEPPGSQNFSWSWAISRLGTIISVYVLILASSSVVLERLSDTQEAVGSIPI